MLEKRQCCRVGEEGPVIFVRGSTMSFIIRYTLLFAMWIGDDYLWA